MCVCVCRRNKPHLLRPESTGKAGKLRRSGMVRLECWLWNCVPGLVSPSQVMKIIK